MPLMRKINPSLNETLTAEAEIFNSVQDIFQNEIERIREVLALEDGERLVLSIPKIKALRVTPPILYAMLNTYGFSFSNIKSILNALQANPGKEFLSDDHILLKDRDTLIIEKRIGSVENAEIEIPKDISSLESPVCMAFSRYTKNVDFAFPDKHSIATFDADKLIFPLKLRKWREGDSFIPLGMQGRKKLSDFFIDNKINRFEKDRIWLLLSGGQIIWIIGHRIDDRYKISPETKNVFEVILKN